MANPPLRKTHARALERERARKQMKRRDGLTQALPFVMAAVLLFIGAAVFLAMNPPISGTPRLQVDQESIDLGNRIFNQPVRAVFTVKNIGDGSLQLAAPKIATVLEGC